MSWQTLHQTGEFDRLDALGRDLSAILFCPVRYCESIYGKRIFECKHGFIFPQFAVEAAQQSGDWSQIMEHHRESLKSLGA